MGSGKIKICNVAIISLFKTMHAHSALKTTGGFFFWLFSPWQLDKIINIEIKKTTKHIYYLENVG